MAITKKTFTVADTPIDAGWKMESASTHRKYPATKSQMTLFDRALFMMTSWLPGASITHAMGPHDTSGANRDGGFYRFRVAVSAACEGLFSGRNAELVRSV